jgi:hypothetical protein
VVMVEWTCPFRVLYRSGKCGGRVLCRSGKSENEWSEEVSIRVC